jgi:pimeloyl-ACP methyl ester carboxylesterase
MPYVQSDGIRIYYQVEGEGRPLVMLHGMTGSLDDFYEFGWVKGLKDQYRLILIDARGHGHSDKPHEVEAYKIRRMAQDIVTVLDELDIDKTHFMGFSMGGFIGFSLAKYIPQRLHSLIVVGSHLYTSVRDLAEDRAWWRKSLGRGMKAYMTEAIANSSYTIRTDWFVNRRLANDPEALIAYIEADDGAGFEDILSSNTIPCLLYIGTEDPNYEKAKKSADEMSNARIISILGKAHGEVFQHGKEGVTHVSQFLAEVSQGKTHSGG